MEDADVWNYYKMIRYNIQLADVELVEMECKKNDDFENEKELQLKSLVETKSELVDGECFIYSRVILDFNGEEPGEGPFFIKVAYRGVCIQNGSLDEETFKTQSEEQAVTFLLPYLRECVSELLSRMKLPIYYLPTLDVLQSMKANNKEMQEGE